MEVNRSTIDIEGSNFEQRLVSKGNSHKQVANNLLYHEVEHK